MQQAGARWDDRRFFIAIAIFFALLTFAGFSRSFYLHGLFKMPAPSLFLQIHGAIMTGWIVLLLGQALLIAYGHIAWHRLLGYAGALYALLIIPVGCMATFAAAEREVRAHSAFVPSQLNVLGLELMQLSLFASFVGAAVLLRNRAAYHKRLIVIATLCILPNTIVRLTLLTDNAFLSTNVGILTVWTMSALGVVAVDALRTRKLHKAFAWSMPIAVIALYAAWFVSRLQIWDRFWIAALA